MNHTTSRPLVLTVAAYTTMVDPRAMEALGVRMRIQMSPAGRKVVQQQLCTSYSITSMKKGLTS